ncbi:alpha/beta hydrolase [Xylophilus sp. GOD-11R]|uniref:alpha/beta fold hydrolase n=1 Tax=Xylophilus sp. GOD-11R TaxID=3089814 RepID=UPI00298D57D2|nr:alpha/beta hydrolase [Xylophilus sp. GOD-11R]WPB55632.1 alpha/beta hydrolase [Xylophilus sp. GOD-11R]
MTDSTFLHDGTVTANGIRQHFLHFGGADGYRAHRDTVIIVPGLASPAATWAFVGERFGRHFDTYVLDIRGRGQSESSPALDYRLDTLAADLDAFAAELQLQHWAVVGHSLGARIAIHAAARQPPGLHKLALIDPPLSGPGRRAYPQTLERALESIRLAKSGAGVEGMRVFHPAWSDERLAAYVQGLATCDESAVVAAFEGLNADDIHADLPELHVPVLLISAELGEVVSEDEVFEMELAMPGLTEVRVAGAGHMIPWDNEEGFYEAFGGFLGATLDP